MRKITDNERQKVESQKYIPLPLKFFPVENGLAACTSYGTHITVRSDVFESPEELWDFLHSDYQKEIANHERRREQEKKLKLSSDDILSLDLDIDI